MKKIFPLVLFVVLYLLIWDGLTLLIHSPYSISPDTAENIMWGMHPSLMYDKHPGLGALFLKPFVLLFSPLLANLLATSICIVVTWLYIYKIIRLYFEHKEAIFVTLLSLLSFFYMGEFFLQYNQNIILLPFWTASAYFFIKAIDSNRTIYWLLTALIVALAVYAKFQIAIVAVAMLAYLIFNYKACYTKNILLSAIFGFVLLIPGMVSLYELNFITIHYVAARVAEPNSSMLFNIFNGLFDSIFQLLNFAVAIVILLYLAFRKNIIRVYSKLSNNQKAIVYIGVVPYIIFCLLEMFNGALPTEWLVCATALFIPAIYVLFRLKTINISLYKIEVFGLIVNLIYFIAFNISTFTNNKIEHNNIGNGIAVVADNLIKDNHLAYPEYASGSWDYGLYLTAFMSKHPNFVREWYKLSSKGSMVMVFPGCGGEYGYIDNDIKTLGYTLIYKTCQNVQLTDKIKPQEKPFTFYFVEK
ncbi:glycosyltransferase family 39 protein [Francisella philomiragia]|uniref:glycosyltransferase family 39 protein n=1 Tax=Francisella philomiragia TaxID=28110 RepID=UPI003519A36D